ncbi:hypothetical protein [Pelomonas sp. KK5]|uniref:hypothetical protein n=1 Tax=Pelomonas sp. KK5 TaxID=1855730 RepID=UPI00117D1184|nr:hypothetical protein [Pelomonas sp. KK5]
MSPRTAIDLAALGNGAGWSGSGAGAGVFESSAERVAVAIALNEMMLRSNTTGGAARQMSSEQSVRLEAISCSVGEIEAYSLSQDGKEFCVRIRGTRQWRIKVDRVDQGVVFDTAEEAVASLATAHSLPVNLAAWTPEVARHRKALWHG